MAVDHAERRAPASKGNRASTGWSRVQRSQRGSNQSSALRRGKLRVSHSIPRKPLRDWLRHAREPYLGYLRNLSSQIFLGGLGLFMGTKLDFDRIDWANWGQTFLCFSLLLFCILAICANSFKFYEEAFASFRQWVRAEEIRLRMEGRKGVRFALLFAQASWKERRVDTCFLVVCGVFQCIAIGVVSASSTFSAAGLWNLVHS